MRRVKYGLFATYLCSYNYKLMAEIRLVNAQYTIASFEHLSAMHNVNLRLMKSEISHILKVNE